MFGLNAGQTLAVGVGILSALATASAQLTTLFGAHGATMITAVCTLGTLVLSVPLTMLFTQTQQLKAVTEMPGVEKISVNAAATATLAALALDPTQGKIAPTPDAAQAVRTTVNRAG